ncbi:hypothetical protein KKE60_00870 [Patescibacteria group bacterium]|nr:hypothetical protein [Patescibacteria group bacterium]MBU0922926.1 hypothetical protein [Patescibacteria group bacterium]MBU1066341.1 hypothetical protein [Patescibacteria group bacterium]MBU1844548.1 hypothetical protein [Patescibacteria group bacterium]
METYEKKMKKRLYLLSIVPTILLIAAGWAIVLEMWLKTLILSLVGLGFYMIIIALGSKWDDKGRWFYWLGIIFIILALTAFGYGLYCSVP